MDILMEILPVGSFLIALVSACVGVFRWAKKKTTKGAREVPTVQVQAKTVEQEDGAKIPDPLSYQLDSSLPEQLASPQRSDSKSRIFDQLWVCVAMLVSVAVGAFVGERYGWKRVVIPVVILIGVIVFFMRPDWFARQVVQS